MHVLDSKYQLPVIPQAIPKTASILYIGESTEIICHLGTNDRVSLVNRENTYSAMQYLLSEGKPDAILCDAVLPGDHGFDLHSFIRKYPEMNRVPFILVACAFREDLFRAALDNRVDDFYVLPLPGVESLLSRIHFLKEYRVIKDPVSAAKQTPLNIYRIPRSKRIFDIIVATGALVLLSPVLFLVMIAIRLESKGKVYYTSRRVGQVPFDFYKFRSMRSGSEAELGKLAKEKNKYSTGIKQTEVDFSNPCPRCSQISNNTSCSPILHIGSYEICEYWYHFQKSEIAKTKGSFIKIKNDPRITRVGKIIRNLSIDELPQLINVIKGEMSLVGNRPLPVYEAEKLTLDEMAKRFLAPAGLTGLWQVELRSRSGAMSEEERKRLDNQYADLFINKNYTFWFDLRLIMKTIPALFQKETV